MGVICPKYPDCCDGFELLYDEYVNQTYAATHWYCYLEGHPPGWTADSWNSSNYTNLSGIVFTRPPNNNDYGVNPDWEDEIARKKRLYVDIPIMLSQISGAFSIFTCTAVIAIFIAILIYQPIMYVFV
jgi:hypothetical protein